MTLRRADPSYFEDLMTLEKVCFRPEKQDSPSALKASLKNPKHEVWVTADKGSILGAMSLRILRCSARIQSLAVTPSHQGRGLGAQLMRQAIERSRDAGVGHVTLEVDASNQTLINWYQNLGFKKTAELPNYYAEGSDGIRMRMTLSA